MSSTSIPLFVAGRESVGRDAAACKRTIGVMDSGFSKALVLFRSKGSLKKLLLHGEAIIRLMGLQPEQPTRKALTKELLSGRRKRSRSLARLESIGSPSRGARVVFIRKVSIAQPLHHRRCTCSWDNGAVCIYVFRSVCPTKPFVHLNGNGQLCGYLSSTTSYPSGSLNNSGSGSVRLTSVTSVR